MEDREKCEELQNNENRHRVEDHEDPEKTHYFWIQSTEAEEATDKRKTLTELITNQTLNKKETSPEADAHGQNPQQATTQKEESKDGEKPLTSSNQRISCSVPVNSFITKHKWKLCFQCHLKSRGSVLPAAINLPCPTRG